MFEKIIFPTDFSEYAKKTLDCIAGFPDNREVILLHVVDTSKPGFAAWGIESMKDEARRQLRDECHYLRGQGLAVKTVLREIPHGPIGEAVVREAKDTQASLVLVGARGKSVLRDIILGSVSSYVLRYCPVHVLIMRYRIIEGMRGRMFEKFCPRILSKVLCPTDFSSHSRKVLEDIAPLKGLSEVLLLHVIDGGENDMEIEMRKEQALRELQSDQEFLAGKGIASRFVVRTGNPAQEINRLAEEEDVSLISLGSHGRGWLGGIMPGSTAQEVAETGKRPVLVLRPKIATNPRVMADLNRSG